SPAAEQNQARPGGAFRVVSERRFAASLSAESAAAANSHAACCCCCCCCSTTRRCSSRACSTQDQARLPEPQFCRRRTACQADKRYHRRLLHHYHHQQEQRPAKQAVEGAQLVT